MSVNLYVSGLAEDIYDALTLNMPASGHLNFTPYNPQDPQERATFTLPPNPDGWREAEALIAALQEWIRHTKEDL
jgi:hypothetical protein